MIKNQELLSVPKFFTFWDKLTQNQKNKILDNMMPIRYNKGMSIHDGGNDCIGVLLIQKGELRIYILSDEGKEITLYRLREGDICILSASCILENITFDVHIEAESDCDVLQIDSSKYASICKENIYVESFTDKLVIQRFSDVMWAMEQILFMSFDKRLAVFLFDEMSRKQTDRIEMTHEQIAKYIGSAREVVSRMLKYFAQEEIVRLYRGGVKVINKKKLLDLIR